MLIEQIIEFKSRGPGHSDGTCTPTTDYFMTKQKSLRNSSRVILILITFYSPSCLGHEAAKGYLSLRVKLPSAHLSTTHGQGIILSL